jgi:hypothetical protein
MEKSDHGKNQTAWIGEKDQLQYLVNIKYIFENILISNYPSVKLLYSEYKTVEAIG